MKGIFITAKDLEILEGITNKHAYRLLNTIKDSLSKERSHGLTPSEYARYKGIAVQEVLEALKPAA